MGQQYVNPVVQGYRVGSSREPSLPQNDLNQLKLKVKQIRRSPNQLGAHNQYLRLQPNIATSNGQQIGPLIEENENNEDI